LGGRGGVMEKKLQKEGQTRQKSLKFKDKINFQMEK